MAEAVAPAAPYPQQHTYQQPDTQQWAQQGQYYDANYYAYYQQQQQAYDEYYQRQYYHQYYQQQLQSGPAPPPGDPPPGTPGAATATSSAPPAPPSSSSPEQPPASSTAAQTPWQPQQQNPSYNPSTGYQQYQAGVYYGQPGSYGHNAWYQPGYPQQQGTAHQAPWQSQQPLPPSSTPAAPAPWLQQPPQATPQQQQLPQPAIPTATYASVTASRDSASYNSVPPPSHASKNPWNSATTQQTAGGMVIRPQMSKAAAAAARATVAAGKPSYTQVGKTETECKPKQAGKSWPPSLRNFVERAFLRCKSPDDRKATEASLKQVISQAEASGELWTRNWDTAPLPHIGAAVALDIERAVDAARAMAAENAQFSSQVVSPSGKRKWGNPPSPHGGSSEDDDDPLAAQKRARRAQRFGDGHADGAVDVPSQGMKKRLQANGIRYSGGAGIVTKANISAAPGEEIDWSAHTVRGTCQALEKSYFRLTCAPDPSTVRPEPVLRQALARLLCLLRDKKENYFYAQDQFKAMRQDCTVQHINNAFTAEVYEAHARAALDYGEMGDYIQCQTKLNELYAEGIEGSHEEFGAYYLLHLVAHSQLDGEDGALQRTALMNRLRKLTPAEKALPAIAHALQVRAAAALDNPRAFFKLKACAPNLGARIMDVQEERMRFNAMTVLTRALKPTIPVSAVARILGFVLPCAKTSNETEQCLDCINWLLAHGAVVKDADGPPLNAKVDCKQSADNLYIPDKEDACAHGDANLAVDDFMKRAVAI